MASDTEDLVLSISADVRQMQRALARLTADTAETTKVLAQQFDTAGVTSAKAFDRTAAASSRAATAIQADQRRVQASINTSRFATANMAAQLNDIGVQLASGTSPLTVALQQGTQINQILGGGGLRGTVSLLGGAFASLLNPVSLATIAIIGLGGYAVQYFRTILDNDEPTASSLEKQADLIGKVADRWGEAVPALKEYAEELKKQKNEADLNVAVQERLEQILAQIRTQVPQIAEEVFRLNTALLQSGDSEPLITALNTAMETLSRTAEDGTVKAEDLKSVQDALAAAFAQTGTPAANLLAQTIANLADQFAAAADEAANLNAQRAAALARGDGIGFSDAGAGRGGDPRSFEDDPYWRDRYLPSPERAARPRRGAGGSRRGGRSSAASEAEREREAVAKLIADLEHEYSLIGATNEERAVANALRRAGSAATDEQKARIADLVSSIHDETEALKQSEEQMKALHDAGKSFLSSFIQGLRDGKSASEALASALDRLADKLIDDLLSSLLGGSGGLAGFGGGGLFGGRIIPGILHGGGTAGVDGYGHGRSVPASAFAGAPRMHSGGVAGLQPGEVPAILQRGEVVLPRGTRAGGGQTVQVIDQRRGGAPVTAEKSRGPDGRELVKLYVRDELQSGGFDGAMGGRFGTRARKVRRN